MKRACEHYEWFDFKEILTDELFPDADSVKLNEEGHYEFSVDVEEDGEVTHYEQEDIENMWYKIEDRSTVYDMHVDNHGVWIVYCKECEF